MKWPKSLTLIRHDKSAFNALKENRKNDPTYQNFLEEFDKDPLSETTYKLALQMKEKNRLGMGDHKTPLAEGAGHQSIEMARNLKNIIELPDVIFVSPYERTYKTLAKMQEGWPELKDVKIVEEGRIREQEHGLALLYNDWRVFHTLHPEQRDLFALEGDYYYRYPQGESMEDVRERTRSWFGSMIRDFPEKNVLAVTHHLTILGVRANLERMNTAEFMDLDKNNKPINAGVTIYRGNPDLGKDGKLILDQYNTKLY